MIREGLTHDVLDDLQELDQNELNIQLKVFIESMDDDGEVSDC